MAKKGRGPWEEEGGHTSAPQNSTLHMMLCLACTPQHRAALLLQLPGPTQVSSPTHVTPPS